MRLLRRSIALLSVLAPLPAAVAQGRTTQINGFGHLEQTVARRDSTDAYFSLGEHSLFLTSSLSPRVSFLGEFVVRFNTASATTFLPSIERSLIRFAYANNHALIAGKVHTPVNYWNDAYHHGRLFYPVIDRPFAFSHLVPLHTLGLQLQGQNLGAAKFGYDAMIGNGIASTDAYNAGTSPAALVSVHVKPVSALRIGASLYRDQLDRNQSGTHSGHTLGGNRPARLYTGAVDFTLGSLSVAWFGRRLELLSETSINRNRTDTLGVAVNRAAFGYLGWRARETMTPFIYADVLRAADNDLHVYPIDKRKVGLGVRYDASALINLKAQWEVQQEGILHDGHWHQQRSKALRLQVAYGF